MLSDEICHEYKTVVLIGGELNDIQVVNDKNEKIYEAVVSQATCWQTKLYRESNTNAFEFILQD